MEKVGIVRLIFPLYEYGLKNGLKTQYKLTH